MTKIKPKLDVIYNGMLFVDSSQRKNICFGTYPITKLSQIKKSTILST